MLMIRLQRVGRKNVPTFRVVLTDKRNSTKSGRFLEVLGAYDPREGGVRKLDGERIKELLKNGAQATGTVHNLLVSEKIVSGKKVNVLPRKSPPAAEAPSEEKKEEVQEEKSTEAPAAETAAA